MAAPSVDSIPGRISLRRILLKGLILFLIVNIAFEASSPRIGKLSLYNWLLAGRERFPQGIRTNQVYNFAIFDLDALFASHIISRPKLSDEYRVLVVGDSAIWGVYLRPEETLAGRLTAAGLISCDGRRLIAYNLGFAGLSVAQDLVILQYAMQYKPDMVIWAISLDALRPDLQEDRLLLDANPRSVEALNQEFGLGIDIGQTTAGTPWYVGLMAHRRQIADLARMQFEGVMWSATGIDELYKKKTQRSDAPLGTNLAYAGQQPPVLNMDRFLFNGLTAGIRIAGNVPVLIVNEPILIGRGTNSDVRYNAAYPRWAFDQYRGIMLAASRDNGWNYADAWNTVPADDFADTPFHLGAKGERILADALAPGISELACKAVGNSR